MTEIVLTRHQVPKRGDERSGGHVLLGIADFFEVKLDRFGEIIEGFGDRPALASHVHLKTLRATGESNDRSKRRGSAIHH